MNELSALQKLTVSSASFSDGGSIPSKYGYVNENISPQISWSAEPSSTKSYVVICQDPDAPRTDPWVHWVVFNIPASILSLDESAKLTLGIQLGLTDYKKSGWGGPNPPSGTHRYYFYVYALDSDLSELKGQTPTAKELMKAMEKHKVLAHGQLMGTFAAKK